jgi:predicted Zn-dependent peptidase
LEFLSERLENGLTIVAERNGNAHSVAVGFFVNAGARDETDALAGVSHFLEHMAFKGTPTRSADDVNRQFDEIGAQYNAFTSEENTVYYAAVLPEHQPRVMELLADILRPALRQHDFDTEKQVILEEIHMVEDQPPFGADEKCRAALYGPHPLGRSVLGSLESIGRLRCRSMRDYFRRRYSPGNVALVATGRIDFEALVASARQWCGSWEPADGHRLVEPAACQTGFHVISKPGATQQYAVQLAPGPAAADHDRYPAKLLAMVLGDETGSRLFWELVDPGLAEQASLAHGEYEGSGVFATYLACEPDQAAKNLQRIRELYRRTESEGISAAELKQAVNKVSSRIVLSGEIPRGRLFTVGSDWVQRRQYRSIRDDLDAVAAITLDDVAAVLAKYPLTRSTTVTIGPLKRVRQPK